MLNKESLVIAFEKLGKELVDYTRDNNASMGEDRYDKVIRQAQAENPWFIPEYVKFALKNIGQSLSQENILTWISQYSNNMGDNNQHRTIGVVMAGNVPLVGFHDFMAILFSGNKVLGKMSSDDSKLMPLLASRLIYFYPVLEDFITLTEDEMKGFDAIIATGSNNTSRYFKYYFGKYPHIIRKNRNGIAVLTGNETTEDLRQLGEDVFLYFGLGCRNVSKLYVPEGYDFRELLRVFEDFQFVGNTNKYRNNYDYYRSIYLINKVHHYDNGIVMLTENADLSSPPSVLFYEEYEEVCAMNSRLQRMNDQIQCVVSISDEVTGAIPPGTAQRPALWDYADGVDTMAFLLSL